MFRCLMRFMALGTRDLPRQATLPPTLAPRLVNRAAAAAYVCVSPNTFDRMVKDGAMPRPKLSAVVALRGMSAH